MRRALLVFLLPLAIAGCVDSGPLCDLGAPRFVQFEGWDTASVDQPWQGAFLWNGTARSDTLDLTSIGNWTIATAPAGGGTHTIVQEEDGCIAEATITLQEPQEGAVAEIGLGTLVRTAGFWENGSLFYTNIQQVHDAWPERGGWYAWESADPLQVYVYDQDSSEMPRHWGNPDRDLAGTPLAGSVNLPTEYSPTIPGFNEALKGLTTTTVSVAHLAPADGYTRQGAETHPLYGDPLLFVIKLDAVADVPCPHDSAVAGCFRS